VLDQRLWRLLQYDDAVAAVGPDLRVSGLVVYFNAQPAAV